MVFKFTGKVKGGAFQIVVFDIAPSLRAERSNPDYKYFWIASGYRLRNDGVRQFEIHPLKVKDFYFIKNSRTFEEFKLKNFRTN